MPLGRRGMAGCGDGELQRVGWESIFCFFFFFLGGGLPSCHVHHCGFGLCICEPSWEHHGAVRSPGASELPKPTAKGCASCRRSFSRAEPEKLTLECSGIWDGAHVLRGVLVAGGGGGVSGHRLAQVGTCWHMSHILTGTRG